MSGGVARSKVMRIDAAGLLLTAALAGAAYVVGVEPVYSENARIEQKRRLIEEQSRNASDAEQLVMRERGRLQEYRQRLAATSVRLEPVSRLNQRLVKISQLVEKHALAVQAMDPGVATSDPEIGTFRIVPIRLSGSGTFVGVAAFVRELAETYKDVKVRTLSLSAPAVSTSPDLSAEGSEKAGGAAGPSAAASFVIELRWYAAPAGSADAEERAGAE
jgi:Tfp pilus assembly protein PilO